MNRVLPRKQESEIEPTVLLRSKNPSNHRDFEEILPWFTPLFVWQGKDQDWVRWSVPQPMAEKMGITGGCAHCGKDTKIEGDHGDYLVDTAWAETDWWLEANGYSNPGPPVLSDGSIDHPKPTKEGESS